jgi:hypothetical protein
MSKIPSTNLTVRVYEELEKRGFALRSPKEGGLDFSKYAQRLGFQRIWIKDGSRLAVNSELLDQARGLYTYFSVNMAAELRALGWAIKTDFWVKGTGPHNVWPKWSKTPGYVTAQRRHEEAQKLETQGASAVPPATARFIEFWITAQASDRLRMYKDDLSFYQLIKDIMAAGIIDQQDSDGLDVEKKGLKALNPTPYTEFRLDLPAPLTSTVDSTVVADWIEGEIRKLFDTLGFRLDDFLRKDMNTAKQSNSKIDDYLQEYIDLLEYKGQIILQGPPGTGKTYLAKDIAERILTGDVSDNKEDQSNILNSHDRYKLIQFHPSYTYEDFVRGIVVNTTEQTVKYEVTNRVLAQFARQAQRNPDRKYVLIIDEINRANLSAVFGELIYALEYRGQPVASMYALKSKDEVGNEREDRNLVLPKKLYIIGTMNTADRSAGHIDYAIRRRFAFVDVPPKDHGFKGKGLRFESELFDKVKALFFSDDTEVRSEFLSEEFSPNDVALGHSYFMYDGDKYEHKAIMKLKLQYEIKPILLEYVRDGVLKETAISKIHELSA